MRLSWRRHVVIYDDVLEREKELSYEHIDEGHFGWLSIFVAGSGFLTDIYNIVAGNIAVPMLDIVYWGRKISPHEKKAITLAPLAGALIGQITFGLLADHYGRKGVYGIVLIIMMAATVGLALSSKGVDGSINIRLWLTAWRLLLGFGIGGDFPLSAAITAEFAPRKHRARMLASVFLMKPVGEILAHIVTIVTITRYSHYIADPEHCFEECHRAEDTIWRWVVGFGAILPVGALLLRLQIPECVRYVLEVEKDIYTARDCRSAAEPTEQNARQSTSGSHPPSLLENGLHSRRPRGSLTLDPVELQQLEGQGENRSIGSSRDSIEQVGQNERQGVRKETWREFLTGFRKFLFTGKKWGEREWGEGSWTDLAGTSLTWMLLDFSFYFMGVYNPTYISNLWDDPGQTATDADPKHPNYSQLLRYSREALVSNSIGASVGAAIFIPMARYRYNLQVYGFLILTMLFAGLGAALFTIPNGRYFGIAIGLHAFTRLFFNLGPNPSVFIIPAEVFPTRYRCTCYGISAAAGKLGSILAQLVVESSSENRRWFGKAILCLIICNTSGAILTKLWVPNPCDTNGESRALEYFSDSKSERRRPETELEARRQPSA